MTKTVFPQNPTPEPKAQKRNGVTFATLTKAPHDKLRAEGFLARTTIRSWKLRQLLFYDTETGSVGVIFSTMMG
jgi:hypothetical protein